MKRISEMQSLLGTQSALMRERAFWESLQSEFVHNKNIFHFCQQRMDMLDWKCDLVRRNFGEDGGLHDGN